MVAKPPVILMPPPQSDEEASLGIPPASQNIFQRIIRDPKVNTPTPKERECTEMLCSVLLNAPAVRRTILGWLCGLIGIPADVLDEEDVEVSMDTECSIGGKRDDLRIEISRTSEEGKSLVALLSIEVKAGAHIHTSGRQDDPEAEEDASQPDTMDAEEVSQIVNYDTWLAGVKNRNPSSTPAGIVLARSDMSGEMPKVLMVPWRCVTWTQLAKTAMRSLEMADIPATDAMLARHLIGFIKAPGNGLWRAEEMKDYNLDFDDIALLRALGTHGARLEQKVDALVEPLGMILSSICETSAKPGHSKTLYKSSRRSVCGVSLLKGNNQPPYIFVGICLQRGGNWPLPTSLALWLESGATRPEKPKIKEAVSKTIKALQARNPRWQQMDTSYEDLMISIPLHEVLKQETDQQGYISTLVKGWVEDLRNSGIVEAIKKELEA